MARGTGGLLPGIIKGTSFSGGLPEAYHLRNMVVIQDLVCLSGDLDVCHSF